MARLKCSMRTAVFLTSEEYTSEPTMGQKGTFLPSSCEMPSASAVFPVPGAPAGSREMFCHGVHYVTTGQSTARQDATAQVRCAAPALSSQFLERLHSHKSCPGWDLDTHHQR